MNFELVDKKDERYVYYKGNWLKILMMKFKNWKGTKMKSDKVEWKYPNKYSFRW
jgi:hypothetical protein